MLIKLGAFLTMVVGLGLGAFYVTLAVTADPVPVWIDAPRVELP